MLASDITSPARIVWCGILKVYRHHSSDRVYGLEPACDVDVSQCCIEITFTHSVVVVVLGGLMDYLQRSKLVRVAECIFSTYFIACFPVSPSCLFLSWLAERAPGEGRDQCYSLLQTNFLNKQRSANYKQAPGRQDLPAWVQRCSERSVSLGVYNFCRPGYELLIFGQ